MENLTKHTNLKYNKWYEYNLKIGNNNINLNLINISIKEVYDILKLNNISENQNILIQFKVRNRTGIFRSLSYMQNIKFKEINLFFLFYFRV